MIFLDTAGLLCLFHSAETFHEDAVAAYRAASASLTHGHVLSEFVALAHARRLPRLAALDFVDDLTANPDIETVWVDKLLHEKSMALLRARPDKTYSLCDGISFVLMRERAIDEALTTDRHFEQEGFRKLLG